MDTGEISDVTGIEKALKFEGVPGGLSEDSMSKPDGITPDVDGAVGIIGGSPPVAGTPVKQEESAEGVKKKRTRKPLKVGKHLCRPFRRLGYMSQSMLGKSKRWFLC